MPQTTTPSKWESITFAVATPNGKMYVTILDGTDGRPVEVIIHAGKNGGQVHAWATSLSRMMTTALENGAGVNELIRDLSGQLSDGRVPFQENGVRIHSGPEGVCYALMQYRKIKYRELREKLNVFEDDESDDDEPKRRPARLGR